jgi:hypothetical protein
MIYLNPQQSIYTFGLMVVNQTREFGDQPPTTTPDPAQAQWSIAGTDPDPAQSQWSLAPGFPNPDQAQWSLFDSQG